MQLFEGCRRRELKLTIEEWGNLRCFLDCGGSLES